MDPNTHNVIEPVYLRTIVKTASGYTQPLISTLGIYEDRAPEAPGFRPVTPRPAPAS